MEAARAAVQQHLARDGQSDTTVHEVIAPAVVQEHVVKTHHEEVQTVLDREVHQDHFHTTVQPIKHREVLPEQHTHQMAKVELREFHHGNDGKILAGIEAEKARFKNTREIGETVRTKGEAATVVGQHVHHHVHETVQPVIQKEIIEPTVVHTTIPIHEVVHKEAKFQPVSRLKTMTMEEFQASGGVLGPHGKEGARDVFQGEPHGLGKTLDPKNPRGTIGGRGAEGTTSLTGDLESKVGPNRGSVPGPVADKKSLDATRDGMSKMSISNGQSTGHGTATIVGTEKRSAYPLASGTPASPTSTSARTATPASTGVASTMRSTPGSGIGHSTSTNTNTTTTTTTSSNGSGHARKSSGHHRASSDVYDAATDRSSSPSQKEGLISKIKHAIKH